MNKLKQIAFATAVLLTSALSAEAQTPPKILVVDMAKLFETHWKTQEQNAKLQTDAAKAQDQVTQLQKEGNALLAEYKALDDQMKNPAASAEAKASVQATAQKKYDEIQAKRSELGAFVQNTKNNLQQRTQTFKSLLIEEISKVAVDIAKKKGATFLFDKSGPTLAGVSSILYYDPALEITDEVMARINLTRPAGSPTPAATTAATPANGSPKITLPPTDSSK